MFVLAKRAFNTCLYRALVLGMVGIYTPSQLKAIEISINGVNEALLINRLRELVARLKKLQKHWSHKKGIDLLLEIKQEIESATGEKLSISDGITAIRKELKAHGYKADKELEIIKKAIKHRQHKHRAVLDAERLGYVDITCKDEAKQDPEEELESGNMPVELVVGTVMCLCGLFLIMLPPAPCKYWGDWAWKVGASLCIKAIAGKEQERQDKERDDQKNKDKR